MVKVSELRKLPLKDWREVKRYNQILIIKGGKRHDSGWSMMYIIGCKGGKPIEIAGRCDDIRWDVSEINDEHNLRTEMYYPSGILRFWSNSHDFEIGSVCSSTTVRLVIKEIIIKQEE